ncbi:MAG: hypothetical protein KDD45_06575 [Bdellovibrionales bacterium]|nr:hypothetical protein [Bdellovibrionales bacterium]
MESQGGGNFSSSNNIRYGTNANYNNNVQITTSRITTDKGEINSGQMLANRPEGTTSTRRYHFHEKKYEQMRE